MTAEISKKSKRVLRLQICIAVALFLNVIYWFSVRDVQAQWGNVPPAPENYYAATFGLGDKSFAYRVNSLMLQNMGDSGGRVTPLKDYNFETLTKWFFVQDYLDPRSNYIPQLASYYFGSLQEPEKYRPVLDYLEHVGVRTEGERWRWLAHAVYFARFKLNDQDKALSLAYKLARSEHPDMPGWTRQMPAIILNSEGDSKAAYTIMVEILRSQIDELHPNEVNAMKEYICVRVLTEDERKDNPLCVESE